MKDIGEKKFVVIPFIGVINFTKLNYFIFEMLKKKIWANFQRMVELFTQKIVSKLSKIWVWDSGSEIRDPEKTYSGSRIQGSKRRWIPDPDPQHWKKNTQKNLFWTPVACSFFASTNYEIVKLKKISTFEVFWLCRYR
jgi:hypothetical protein